MSGDAQMILGEWLSLYDPGAWRHMQDRESRLRRAVWLMAGALGHMFIPHVITGVARTHTHTHSDT